MLETVRRLWAFGAKRHDRLKRALGFSFLRSAVTVCEFLALVAAVETLCGTCTPWQGVRRILILAVLCVTGNFATSYFEQTATLESGYFMVADQRLSAGTILRQVPLGFFQESTTGKISATLTTTLSGVESAAAMVMVGIISGMFSALCLLIFMMCYEWRIGVLAGAGMAVYLALVSNQMKLSRRSAPALQRAQTGLVREVLTFLRGIKVSKAFRNGLGDQELKRAIEASCEENITLTRKSMPSQYASGLCLAVFESLILFSALSISLEGADHAKTLILILFSFIVYLSLNQAGSMLSMIGLLDSGLAEAAEIQNAPRMETKTPEEHPHGDEIVLDHVSFSYGEREVLHDVTAQIKPHSLTALIGPSGSGKTTLCQLIARFRDVDGGSITIGGADIRRMSNKELMEKISMVFQTVYLFEDTIANNIRFGRPEATMEEVRRAAKAACCDEFIMALPMGYDTVLQEGGCTLSGGEKQRISIARAMLKDAPIVILDEATSALDAENEHEILSALDQLTEGKTVLMIAHRIKSVKRADQILALNHGTIVQAGTHEELKDRPGLYADFLAARKEAAQWKLSTQRC